MIRSLAPTRCRLLTHTGLPKPGTVTLKMKAPSESFEPPVDV